MPKRPNLDDPTNLEQFIKANELPGGTWDARLHSEILPGGDSSTVGYGLNLKNRRYANSVLKRAKTGLTSKDLIAGGKQLTPEQGEAVFGVQLQDAKDDVNALLGDKADTIPPHLKTVMVDMAYNMGRGRMAEFDQMLQAVKDENWDLVADNIKWRDVSKKKKKGMTPYFKGNTRAQTNYDLVKGLTPATPETTGTVDGLLKDLDAIEIPEMRQPSALPPFSLSEASPPFAFPYDMQELKDFSEVVAGTPDQIEAFVDAFHGELQEERRLEMAAVLSRELRLAGAAGEYLTKKNDTYNSVAADFDISAKTLRQLNGLPPAMTPEDDDNKIPRDVAVLMIDGPSIEGLLNESLDGLKAFIEIADAYTHGWVVPGEGRIDWDEADLRHPEEDVIKEIKRVAPDRFDAERHSLIVPANEDDDILFEPVRTLWGEPIESLYTKSKESAELLNLYKIYFSGRDYLSGSDRQLHPRLQQDPSMFERGLDLLSLGGDHVRGALTGNPRERVSTERFMSEWFGMDPNLAWGEGFDLSEGATQKNMKAAGRWGASAAASLITDPLMWGGFGVTRGYKVIAMRKRATADLAFRQTGERAWKPQPGYENELYLYKEGAYVRGNKGYGTVWKEPETLADGSQMLKVRWDSSSSVLGRPQKISSKDVIPFEKATGGQGLTKGDILPYSVNVAGREGVAVVADVVQDKTTGFKKISYDVFSDYDLKEPLQARRTVDAHEVDELLKGDYTKVRSLDDVERDVKYSLEKNRAKDADGKPLFKDKDGNISTNPSGAPQYVTDEQSLDRLRFAMDSAGVESEAEWIHSVAGKILYLSETVKRMIDTSNFQRIRFWALHKQFDSFIEKGSLRHRALGFETQDALRAWRASAEDLYNVFGKETGRALQTFRQSRNTPGRQQSKAMMKIFKGMEKGEELDPITFGRIFGRMETASQQEQAIIAMSKEGWDKWAVNKVYINGMLSAPATHALIAISGQVYLGYSILEHLLSGMIGKLSGRGASPLHRSGVFADTYDGKSLGASEGSRMLMAYLSTWMSVLGRGGGETLSSKMFKKMNMADPAGTGVTKASRKQYREEFFKQGGKGTMTVAGRATSATSAWNEGSMGALGIGSNFLSLLLQLPTIGISHLDSFMRWQAHEMFVRGHGWTQAVKKATERMKGLQESKALRLSQGFQGPLRNKWSREEFDELVQQEYRSAVTNPAEYTMEHAGSNPTTRAFVKGRKLAEESREWGAMLAMTNRISDTLGEGVTTIGETNFGKYMWPFVGVMWRGMVQTLERTPGVAHLTSGVTRGKMKAGYEQRDMALAKQAGGLLLGSTVMAMAGQGIFTGHGPVDAELRRKMGNNWLPNAIHRFDSETGEHTFIQFHKLDPVGKIAGMAATLAEAAGWTGVENPHWQHGAKAVGMGILDNFGNPIFADELTMIARIFTQPDEMSWKHLHRWLGRKAGAMAVPYSSLARRYIRMSTEMQTMARGFEDELIKTIPGQGTLPAWRNYWGEEVVIPRGFGYDTIASVIDFVSPFPMLITHEGLATISDDDVLHAFNKEMYVPDSMPMHYKGIEVPKAWISRRREIMGKETYLDEDFNRTDSRHGYTLKEAYQRFVARDPAQVSDDNPEGYNLKSHYGRAYASYSSTIPETDFSKKIPGQRAHILEDINSYYREAADEQFVEEIFIATNGEVDLVQAVELKKMWKSIGMENAQKEEMEAMAEKLSGLASPEALGMRIGGRP